MAEHVFFTSICLVLGTILLIFAMRYRAASLEARARLANAEDYRRLAEQTLARQAETTSLMASIQATLTEVGGRLASVEKILKDVE
jgi:phage shock protein A